MTEEGDRGGDGPTLQALGCVHLETPVEGAQDENLEEERGGGREGEGME